MVKTLDIEDLNFILEEGPFFVVSNEDRKFIDVNEKFLLACGFNRDEFIGMSVYELDSNRQSGELREMMESIFLAGKTWQGEISFKSKSGFLFWVEMSIVPLLKNKIKKYAWIGRDITERKGTEQFLANSQVFSMTLMQEAPIGLFMAGVTGQCTYVNDKWLNFCGLKSRAVLGEGWKKAIHPNDLSLVLTSWSNFVNQKDVFKCQYRYIHPSGKDTHVIGHAIHLKDSQGNLTGILRTEQDITELVDKEQLIADQQAAMVSAAKLASLGEMAGGVAHEINNPLAIISASVRLLRKMISSGKIEPAVLEQIMANIDNTIMRIGKIVSGLRNLSRDASREEFTLCSIMDCLGDTLALCREKFNGHGVDLTIDVNEVLQKKSVELMRVQFSQVLLNLLNNAFDAVDKQKDKWVKIIVEEEDERFVLRVMDSGAGISKEIQEKIFQPFFTTKEIGKGTGLGLSLANTMVTKHGGKIYLDGNNKNTCFVISIPQRQGK